MGRAPTVSELIDGRPLSRFQIRTMSLCVLIIVLDGFDAQSIGFLAPSMADSLRIPVRAFGPVFGAALFGLMISSMAAGLVADRLGRKWMIVASTVTFGLFAALTPQATTIHQLELLRFLTGLGLGGAMSNVTALLSEYAPKRLLSVSVCILFTGMPVGALLGAMVSWVMLPRWGWQSVFYAGGILPMALSLALIGMLPESVRFLEVRGAEYRKIAGIMGRISPELARPELYLSMPREDRRKPMPVKFLFAEGRATGTILLWIPFFMNLLILYFVVNWLPSLLRQAQFPVSAGILAIIMFSVGGMAGSFAEGYMMNAWGTFSVMLAEFVATVTLIVSLGFSTSLPVIMAITLLLGFAVQGAQGALNAVAATFYPTAIRSTGVGWAIGVGRIGSIMGPMLGGLLLTLRWGPREILQAGAIPAVCAAAATLWSMARQRKFIANRNATKVIEDQVM